MELPIKYRLYNGWLQVKMMTDEHWQGIRKTSATSYTPISQNFGNDFKKDGKWFYKELIGGIIGHNGIDLTSDTGTCLYAPESGKIVVVKTSTDGNKIIVLQSANYEHHFYHLDQFNVVEGEEVVQGQLIGWTDNTGKWTTAPHLHWGVRPRQYDVNNGYHGFINHRDLVDFDIVKLPFRDGMFLQRIDTKNGGHGEVYEVVDGLLHYWDTQDNPALNKNHLVHRVLRLLKNGIESGSITGITEDEWKKYKHLLYVRI